MGSQDWQVDRRRSCWSFKMDHLLGLGTSTHVSYHSVLSSSRFYSFRSNPANPRLASSSKDGTVRVWNTTNRRLEYTLGSHTASVNVVRWGGGSGKGALYTASSDRTVKVWDPSVSLPFSLRAFKRAFPGEIITHAQRPRTLGDHARPQH